jgi:thymidylate synthase ThyX
MGATAKVIEHSTGPHGVELITLQLRYQRFIHAEFMTHRVFSRNASSSRAIPVAKMLDQVRNDPAMPVHWGLNQPGMQAAEEGTAPVLLEEAIEHDNPSDCPLFTFERTSMSVQDAWREAARRAAEVAEAMSAAGYHKQVVNRILEPFQYISVIVTATDWDNFFELRDHPDAQPEIRALAQAMKEAMQASTPVFRHPHDYEVESAWHLPYVTTDERIAHADNPRLLAKLSAARCARVSYLTHDGQQPSIEKDLELYDRLVGSRPLHASPVEHQAMVGTFDTYRSRNFRGWLQFREQVEAEASAEDLISARV